MSFRRPRVCSVVLIQFNYLYLLLAVTELVSCEFNCACTGLTWTKRTERWTGKIILRAFCRQ